MLLSAAFERIVTKNDFYSYIRGDALSYTQRHILNFLAEITYEEIVGVSGDNAELLKRVKAHVSLLNRVNDDYPSDELKRMIHFRDLCKKIDEMYPHRKLEYVDFN